MYETILYIFGALFLLAGIWLLVDVFTTYRDEYKKALATTVINTFQRKVDKNIIRGMDRSDANEVAYQELLNEVSDW